MPPLSISKTMELGFQQMDRKYATAIAGWRYDYPYHIYGYSEEIVEQTIEYLMKVENRFYGVLCKDELIGFRSFGPDGRVSGGHYDESYLDTGGGLRPDLAGKGLGSKIILEGLIFGSQQFGTNRFRVTVADFNKRAKKACEKIGFRVSDHFFRKCDGEPFTIFTIDLETEIKVVLVIS